MKTTLCMAQSILHKDIMSCHEKMSMNVKDSLLFDKAHESQHKEEVEKRDVDDEAIKMKLQLESSHVYVKDTTYGWLPGVLIDSDEEKGIARVVCKDPKLITKSHEVTIKLKDYGTSKSLPLQCIDTHGSEIVVDDMRDLPYSNEPSILYNLKARYEVEKTPYTRATSSVMVAINPYEWIEGLYAETTRRDYADKIVWKGMKMEIIRILSSLFYFLLLQVTSYSTH